MRPSLPAWTRTTRWTCWKPSTPRCAASAACALFFHIRNRLIRWDIVLPAALGGCVTAAIAAWIATGLDVSLLRRLFGGFLLLTGLRELFFRQQRDKNAR